ncbi:STAS domain-containing protein [Azospirillum soli]|uniref:STAS domain-containing protein n=1 Tax=Azospirillum soli TaxID=1304799 RepID=UPI001AE2C161|nr:STAS domain-containing protein [Azospirillum soli]MBP2311516.1 anti-anti-sigma factor [Azospirillum soli]
MQYRKESERHFARLVMTGRLTGQDADQMRGVIAEVKCGADRRYLLDLSGLTFIDSAGIGMLLVVNGEAVSMGKPLAMLTGRGQVKKIVSLTRIAMIIPAFESVDDYIAASVPEAVLASVHPCAPGEDPLAVAARALQVAAVNC